MVGKELIIDSLRFTPLHIFAFIHISGSRDYDISFKNAAFLDMFWARYEDVKNCDLWKDFEVIKISENSSRYITILFKTEAVPSLDISFWLRKRCKEVGKLKPIFDRNGFWIGGYNVAVKLYSTDKGLVRLPNFISIGSDRGFLFYPGQPKVCHKCGSGRHFGTDCTKLYCARCGQMGHLARDCKGEVKCNLCGEGHIYFHCPRSENNSLPSELLGGLSAEEQMNLDAEEMDSRKKNNPDGATNNVFASKGGEEGQGLQQKIARDPPARDISKGSGKRFKKSKNIEALGVLDMSTVILNSIPTVFREKNESGLASDVINDVMTPARDDTTGGELDTSRMGENLPDGGNNVAVFESAMKSKERGEVFVFSASKVTSIEDDVSDAI
uniref:CCHC-type domain-containing protein n=1 Tax=Latimeria chalumnae TaxID=7897 RepID=M3XIR8_LATCH